MKFNSEYLQNISIVAAGSIFAQLVGVILAPSISRLYGPDAFGEFSLFLSIVTILEVVVCLKYDMAIVLPQDDETAGKLFWLSLYITLMMMTITFLVIIAFDLNDRYSLLPLTIGGISFVNIANTWNVRKKKFKYYTVIQAIVVLLNNVLAFLYGFFQQGDVRYLILSYTISYMSMGFVALCIVLKNDSRCLFSTISKMDFVSNVLKYRRFALYNSPASLLNIVSQRLPAFFFPQNFGFVSLGYYELVYRMLKLPTQVVGNAVKNVFFQKTSEEYNVCGSFQQTLKRNIRGLLYISFFPLLLIATVSPLLFGFVFGSEWKDAGIYVTILVPWILIAFIVTPLSSALSVTANDKLFFTIQVISLLLRIGAIGVGCLLLHDLIVTLILFSVVGCWYQGYILYAIAKISNIKLSVLIKEDRKYIVLSIVASVLVYLISLVNLIVAVVIVLFMLLIYIHFIRNKLRNLL